MRKVVDLTGKRFGRLLVLKQGHTGNRGAIYWLCKCDCGNEKEIEGNHLKGLTTKSCGCYRKEKVITHGETIKGKTSEYRCWIGIKKRCLNSKSSKYEIYGGRGISICDRWAHSFDNFLIDMGRKPSNEYSIERKDVNGNYEPSNCIWATPTVQSRNKRIQKSNKSGIVGVCLRKRNNKWCATITAKGKKIQLGEFKNIEEAAEARRLAEIKYW